MHFWISVSLKDLDRTQRRDGVDKYVAILAREQVFAAKRSRPAGVQFMTKSKSGNQLMINQCMMARVH